MNDTTNSGAMRLDNDEPNLQAMAAELTTSAEQAADRIAAMASDENTRYCRWAGQQENGRKPATVGGRPAEPWPGSADTRHHLVDEIVRDQVALMKIASRKARLTVRGTEQGDMARGGKTQVYMDHLRDTRIRSNVRRETELAANWRQTHGYAIMSITWAQEWARDYERITLAGLQEAAANGNQPVAAMLESLYDPDRQVRKELVNQLRELYPDLDQAEAWKQLQLLRDTGEASLPVRYLRVNRPQWEALKPWRDIFMPANTEDVQKARWVAWRVLLNASQLEEKAISENWAPDFIAAVRKTEGKTILEHVEQSQVTTERRGTYRDREEAMEGLHEVFYFYYTHVDDTGVPCHYRTVMSPHVAKVNDVLPYGLDEPVGYDHGQLPFVEMRAELPDRLLVESRGVAQVGVSWQTEKKHLRDARINQTDLVLQPPWIRPEREVGLPLQIRPRGEIGERRLNTTRQMTLPNTAPAATPLEADSQADANRYFARNRAEDPVRTGLYEEDLAASWCEELAECWKMTLQLAQQFEDSLTFNRIVGGQPVPFTVSREEIQGEYDLQLVFNTDSIDPERLKAKVEVVQKLIAPMDREATLRFAPLVAGLFSYYFPEFSDSVLQDAQQASAREIEDEQKNWALIMAGEEPVMREDNQNFGLRLKWLDNKLAQPGAQARLMQLPDSKQLAERRRQHLQFMVQQNTINAQTGRVGVEAGAA